LRIAVTFFKPFFSGNRSVSAASLAFQFDCVKQHIEMLNRRSRISELRKLAINFDCLWPVETTAGALLE
jgi:hypothetical protein